MRMRTCSKRNVLAEIGSVPVEHMMGSRVVEDSPCRFCHMEHTGEIAANELAFAILDRHPVTQSHVLIIPRRHVLRYFDLSMDEVQACHELLIEVSTAILAQDPTVEGFNIGVNVGAVAGQSIFHCHIHLIPRRRGDVQDPKGGIRHLIPGKGFY